MTPAFVDAFYWIGLANPKDQWRQLVLKTQNSLGKRPLITTEGVLIEVAAGLSSNEFMRSAALTLIDGILADANIIVIPQSHDSFTAGLDFYSSRLDKAYSLVDCISMNCCNAHAITEVLTNDHHFEQEGFSILIK